MAKAYIIVTEEVHDEAKMNEYAGKAIPSLFASGGKILAAAPPTDVVEGEWHGTQTVLLEFESLEAADAWYNGSEYSAVKPLRFEAANCNAIILPGFEMPGA